ncbi:PREDICTED: beta-1,3-galactosyltransferase 5 [Nicrophorus vespilloides]|uniref:Hexosyltransferase n=1 Tax=Nicrophorus vespilloides TaxID=110193 RepID=A0ABM1M911_NICVS|nr:PREDICTED: beta-1,3-galactosyltransferase 5 [Nicrophorus vespilloides]
MYQCNRTLLFTLLLLMIVVVLILTFYYNSETEELGNVVLLDNVDYDQQPQSYLDHDRLFDLRLRYDVSGENCAIGTPLFAVILVTSYFGNVETRSAIRRAFPKDSLRDLNATFVFLLGRKSDDMFVKQDAVLDEAHRFGDILQGNFREAYRNLTYKHLMGLKWASERCANAEYVVKMDDDIVVNLPEILKVLRNVKLPQKLLAGYILKDMEPKREKANKWFVTEDEYRDKVYPTFLSGWFYVTNPKTSRSLVRAVRGEKYFWIDDTFITGILARKVKIKHYNLGDYFTVHPEFLRCCMSDVSKLSVGCEVMIGPNGGDANLFFEFNRALGKCWKSGSCKKRDLPLNRTCVAERVVNLGRGTSVIEDYKLS